MESESPSSIDKNRPSLGFVRCPAPALHDTMCHVHKLQNLHRGVIRDDQMLEAKRKQFAELANSVHEPAADSPGHRLN